MIFSLFLLKKHSETAAKKVKPEKASAFSFQHFIHFFKPGDTEEYEYLWESGIQQCNTMLKADIGKYANHAIIELEKGMLVYQILVAFFVLHIQFLEFSSSVTSFVKAEKAVLLAAG